MKGKKKLILAEQATANGGRKNELYINNDSIKCYEWKVEMEGIGKRKVEHFHDLSEDYEVNSAVITLQFGSDEKLTETKEGEIQYLFSNPNPKSEVERERLETEALVDFLVNKPSASLKFERVENDMKIKMVNNGGKINLLVEKDGSNPREIRSKGIKIKGEFYVREALSLKDIIKIEPDKTKPYLTRNKIILFSVVAIIVVLVAFFRKKIWKWIKGETNQAKKVKEQLDIF